MAIQRMDHVGLVVDDLEAGIAFFVELGLEETGRGTVEGPWVDRVVGLDDVVSDIAFVQTPDGHSRLELTSFRRPAATDGASDAPANARGIRHLTFAVDDLDDVLDRLRPHGAQLVGQVEQFEDIYRLCFVRGPNGIIIELAEPLR